MPADSLTILQVSPSDRGGGAEKVALDLHQSYLAAGLDAWLALGAKYGGTANTIQIPNTAYRSAWARAVLGVSGLADPNRDSALPAPLRRAARMLAEPSRYRRVINGFEDFDAPATAHLLELTPRIPNAIHLHNLHGSYFDIRRLPTVGSRIPTIVTMHDAWLLTGHCAHPMECDGYLSGCEPCPHLDRYVPLRRDGAAQNFRVKREALSSGTVHLATPSRWLAGLLETSGVGALAAEVRTIPNGVDTTVFSPGNRKEARNTLGLPADALIVAFAAAGAVTNPFKDYATLESALPRVASSLKERQVLLLAIGQDPGDTASIDARVQMVPFVDDPEVLVSYYRAADLYVHPARAENFPLVILEAMACGTPVVASNVGGIPEIISDGLTGRLVGVGDSADLATAVVELAGDGERRAALSAAGLRRASELSLERQAASYIEWYEELAQGFRPTGT